MNTKPALPLRMPESQKLSLAMAFVPDQLWEQPYENDVALYRGTLFPSLDLPFLGDGVMYNGK